MERNIERGSQYLSGGIGYESEQYLEKCIQGRNKKITQLYKEIDELKGYNRRDKATLEEKQRQELEICKEQFLCDLNIKEDSDLRCVYIVFNDKFEYIKTLSLSEFSEFIKDKEEYKKFTIKRHALAHYLKTEHLYASSAKHFVNKPLKWYKKSFKNMILSFDGWKVDENGLLKDTEW